LTVQRKTQETGRRLEGQGALVSINGEHVVRRCLRIVLQELLSNIGARLGYNKFNP